MMKLKHCFVMAAGCLLMTLTSCKNSDEVLDETIITTPETPVNTTVEEALMARYPGATSITWLTKGEYAVAQFLYAGTRTAETAASHAAWFDNQGSWYMTETDIPFESLPEAVKTAFAASEYATGGWRLDEVDRLEREGAELVYVIEVERVADGVKTEANLYYSSDGVLVKTVIDAETDYDYEDFIPSKPVTGVDDYLKTNYPNARILEIDYENGMTEVEILDDRICRELLFDRSGNWLYTKTEMNRNTVPASVMQVLQNSDYASYYIDDIDYYQTAERNYYRFELESVRGDVKVEITPEGVLTVTTPGGGQVPGVEEGNGSMLDQEITNFINTNYPNARILEYDYDDGLLEVEIYHDSREKDVYFNGSNSWVITKWDIRRSELPQVVSQALQNSEYASYSIDDIEYIQRPTTEYYLLELERGNREIELKINAQGQIIN